MSASRRVFGPSLCICVLGVVVNFSMLPSTEGGQRRYPSILEAGPLMVTTLHPFVVPVDLHADGQHSDLRSRMPMLKWNKRR
jgi:hypothetical protein